MPSDFGSYPTLPRREASRIHLLVTGRHPIQTTQTRFTSPRSARTTPDLHRKTVRPPRAGHGGSLSPAGGSRCDEGLLSATTGWPQIVPRGRSVSQTFAVHVLAVLLSSRASASPLWSMVLDSYLPPPA